MTRRIEIAKLLIERIQSKAPQLPVDEALLLSELSYFVGFAEGINLVLKWQEERKQ
jgi:hypothetical protein